MKKSVPSSASVADERMDCMSEQCMLWTAPLKGGGVLVGLGAMVGVGKRELRETNLPACKQELNSDRYDASLWTCRQWLLGVLHNSLVVV